MQPNLRLKISKHDQLDLAMGLDNALAIVNLSKAQWLTHYIDNKIGKDHAERARWDLVWMAKQKGIVTHEWFKKQYENGVHDAHIDNLLKHYFTE